MWVESRNGKFRFCEEVKDITGNFRKISVTFDKNTKQTEKQAREILRLRAIELLQTPDKSIKFFDIIDLYEKQHCSNLKVSTQKLYNTKLNKLKKHSKNIEVSKITTRYLITLLKTVSVSDNSYNSYLKLVKAIFKHSFYEDYIENTAVTDKLKYKSKNTTTDDDCQFYELKELQTIYKKLEDDLFYKNLVEFLVNTGLRIGELLALTEKSLSDDLLNIKYTKDQYNNITETKTTNSYRTISLNKRCLEIWQDQIRINKNNKIIRKNYKDKKVIFAKKNGDYNTYSNLRKGYEKIMGEAPKFHIFRHTHASLCFDEGIPSNYIANRLGHGGKEITEKIYIHKTKKQKKEEYQIFKNIEF